MISKGKPVLLILVVFVIIIYQFNKLAIEVEIQEEKLVSRKSLFRKGAIIAINTPEPRSVQASLFSPKPTPMEIAEKVLKDHRVQWNLQDYHQFSPEVIQTPLATIIKYSVAQDGIPVSGISIAIELGKDLSIQRIDNQYKPIDRMDIENNIPIEAIRQIVSESYDLTPGSSELKPIVYTRQQSDSADLAYVIPVQERSENKRSYNIVVKADDGTIIGKDFSRKEF